MPETADVVVIGGGCNGASLAYHLVQRGVNRVVLLEKGGLASGPTGRSGAVVRTHYSNEVTAKMALQALRVFQNFKDVVGGESGFTQAGFLVGVKAQDRAALEGTIAMQRRVGINTRFVTPAEMKTLDPQLYVDDLVGAAYEPESGYADPAMTTASFATRAKDLGATIHQGAEVRRISVHASKVEAVHTEAMTISTPVVVNVAGPWGRRIAQMVGLDLPIEPSRHEICIFHRPHDFGKPHMVFGDFVNLTYLRPELGNLTLIGSIDPKDAEHTADPDTYNVGVEFDSIAQFAAKAAKRYPALSRAFSKGGWAGIYDVTPDWHPILDQVEVQGFYCAVGFSGHGFKLCPVTGAMMAELITTGRCPDPDIGLFRFSRFKEGKPVRGQYEYSIMG